MNKGLLIISTLIGFVVFGQDTRLHLIDEKVKSIELDSTLSMLEFEWVVLPGITTGSRGVYKIWKNNGINKIAGEIQYPDFKTRTTIYLEDGIPIKISEIEENFEQTKNEIDYSKPIEVFKATIYVFDWDKDESKIIRNGERVFTEGNCSTFDYESLIENAKNLILE